MKTEIYTGLRLNKVRIPCNNMFQEGTVLVHSSCSFLVLCRVINNVIHICTIKVIKVILKY